MAKYFGGETMGEIGKQFNRIDADASGDLTWEEVKAAAEGVVTTTTTMTTVTTTTTKEIEEVKEEEEQEQPVEEEVEYTLGAVLQSTVAMVSGDFLLLSFYECSKKSAVSAAAAASAPLLSIHAMNNEGTAKFSITLSPKDWAFAVTARVGSSSSLDELGTKDKLALCQALSQHLVLRQGKLTLGTAKQPVRATESAAAASSTASLLPVPEAAPPPRAPPPSDDVDDLFKTLSAASAGSARPKRALLPRSRSLRRPKNKIQPAAPPKAP
jgi:hypothetical protein